MLRHVELDDSFSSQKRMVISKLRYVPITRVYLQSRTRFWTDQKLSGYANTDLPTRTIADFTDTQPGTRAIIGTETSRPNAHIAGAMQPEERIRWGLEYVSKVFPEMPGISKVARPSLGKRSHGPWEPRLTLRPER